TIVISPWKSACRSASLAWTAASEPPTTTTLSTSHVLEGDGARRTAAHGVLGDGSLVLRDVLLEEDRLLRLVVEVEVPGALDEAVRVSLAEVEVQPELECHVVSPS